MRCIGVNLSREYKYPPNNKLRAWVSQQRYMHFVPRTSYVRGRSIFVFAVRRMQYVHVCVVSACVGCVLRPYQIGALTIQLRTISGPTKTVALAAATSGRGEAY